MKPAAELLGARSLESLVRADAEYRLPDCTEEAQATHLVLDFGRAACAAGVCRTRRLAGVPVPRTWVGRASHSSSHHACHPVHALMFSSCSGIATQRMQPALQIMQIIVGTEDGETAGKGLAA